MRLNRKINNLQVNNILRLYTGLFKKPDKPLCKTTRTSRFTVFVQPFGPGARISVSKQHRPSLSTFSTFWSNPVLGKNKTQINFIVSKMIEDSWKYIFLCYSSIQTVLQRCWFCIVNFLCVKIGFSKVLSM